MLTEKKLSLKKGNDSNNTQWFGINISRHSVSYQAFCHQNFTRFHIRLVRHLYFFLLKQHLTTLLQKRNELR